MDTETLYERSIQLTPALGALRLVATDEALVAVYFADHRRPRDVTTRIVEEGVAHRVLDQTARELVEYAEGTRTKFTVPCAPVGTEFQRAVWDALSAIPHGETRSYAELALAIGRPRAVRAVGSANALNPLSIVVPCHRVIGKSGDLTGYAGGVDRKAWLLAHESTQEHQPRSINPGGAVGEVPGSRTAPRPSRRAQTSETMADAPSAGEPA